MGDNMPVMKPQTLICFLQGHSKARGNVRVNPAVFGFCMTQLTASLGGLEGRDRFLKYVFEVENASGLTSRQRFSILLWMRPKRVERVNPFWSYWELSPNYKTEVAQLRTILEGLYV